MQHAARNLIAIDLGGPGGRVILVQLDEGRLQTREIHRFYNEGVTAGPHVYWDVLRLHQEILHGLKLAAQATGHIASIGIDTWGTDIALLDRHDELLANPYHYRDDRTLGLIEELDRRLGKHAIYQATGIQFMRVNTLCQLLATAQASPWQLENARSMLMMPDLFGFWLCGEKGNEFTNASTTQMLDARSGDWNRDILGGLGIPTHFLQPISQPGTLLGPLRPSVRQATGLREAQFIATATHDTASAVVAVPARGRDFIFISSGTWSLVGLESESPLINADTLAWNITNEGGVGGTTRVLKNVMGLWLLQACRTAWHAAGQSFDYPKLMALAAAQPPGQAFIDPDDERFLAPGDMPARIADYCRQTGQAVPETPAALTRTILESLALKYRFVAERLEHLAGRPLPLIHIVGGGSQNSLLCQLTADITGKPVIAGPAEATALGNALVQALALGFVDSLAHARQLVQQCGQQEYSPGPDTGWEERYQRFLRLLTD